jgi:hypothetical protein
MESFEILFSMRNAADISGKPDSYQELPFYASQESARFIGKPQSRHGWEKGVGEE